MLLKPDRLNGQRIFRGVTVGSDGLNHQNEAIIFPPTIHAPHGPVKSLKELVELALKNVVPAKQDEATIHMVTQLRKALAFWMKRATLNERERCRLALEKHGMKEAQHAMMDMTDG